MSDAATVHAADHRTAIAGFLRGRLLPGLLLARVDGKSPVEYLTDPLRQETVPARPRRRWEAAAAAEETT